MSVQLSVVIWTVINFCILMLVLQKLLFKPMLAFMDKRAEKIKRVRDKKAQHEAEAAAAVAEAEQAEAERIARLESANAAALITLRAEAESEEVKAEKAGKEAFESAKADIENEKAEAKAYLSGRTDELAAQFNERLIVLR